MSWTPDPVAFLADLEATPTALRDLAGALEEDPWRSVDRDRRIVCIGMGSSRFAALPVVTMLRARGVDAIAERASASVVAPGGSGTLAIGISASGTTRETVEALARHRDAGSATVAITNGGDTALAEVAERHLPMLAGEEAGGVACRSFRHTFAILLASIDAGRSALAARRAADASEDLLARREAWLRDAADMLGKVDPRFLIAPQERISSALQGALMFREGPRQPADACETGDWLHVDVYLTKPMSYRAVLFAGSRFDTDVVGWIHDRGGRVLAVGARPDADVEVRLRGDDDADVAMLTEILVPELLAAEAWRREA
jgi:glucosamine--fructose-6-phosphate aminotransferase (isomerizing)